MNAEIRLLIVSVFKGYKLPQTWLQMVPSSPDGKELVMLKLSVQPFLPVTPPPSPPPPPPHRLVWS